MRVRTDAKSSQSTKPSRIAENIDAFGLRRSDNRMAAIDGLYTGCRGGPIRRQSPSRHLSAGADVGQSD